MYMQARYYDPVIGRFYSNDPVDAMGHVARGNPIHGFNRYTYANNNPYKYTDPTGESGVLISPKITPRLTPVAQGVRQGLRSNQQRPNPVQQQTDRIANQMKETVKNSRPEVKQPSLREAPKSPSDTTGGILSNLVKQIIKHAEDFVGGNGAVSVTDPSTGGSDGMSTETLKDVMKLDALANPTKFSPERMTEENKI